MATGGVPGRNQAAPPMIGTWEAMAFTLSDVVPWGRSYDEYLRMFGLGGRELRLRILGCAMARELQRGGHTPRYSDRVVRSPLSIRCRGDS